MEITTDFDMLFQNIKDAVFSELKHYLLDEEIVDDWNDSMDWENVKNRVKNIYN
jgi:hypothetical protein